MTTTPDRVALPRQRVDVDSLQRHVHGAVHAPHEPAYAALVTPWNLAVPMQPVAVVAARTGDDVVATVRFAADHGLTVGVQATGHGAVSRHAGQLLVSTHDLDEVTVHPEGWARIGAGVKWGRVVQAASPYGLAPLCGSSGDVGVVGYLTGGGVGPMARTHGLSADKVRAFEVVTGDGVLRRVTPTAHPDLFFALRGGKGVAGIVTAVEVDLVQMSTFYGGALYFDGQDAAAVVARWREWSASLPEEATTSFVLLQLPPLPFVPPPLAGRLTLGVRFLWTGEPSEGRRLLAPMREVAPVLIDGVEVMPYAAVDAVHADPVDPMPVVERAVLLTDFPAEAADALLAHAGPGSGSPQVVVEVRQLGGALGRDGEHASAFDHRAAGYSLFAVGMAPDPTVPGHGDALLAAFAPWDTGGIWPNFHAPRDADSARRAEAKPTLRRLFAVPRRYDPAGILAGGAFARAAVEEPVA
jgi:FAD/FMN-containing dehydrogenase